MNTFQVALIYNNDTSFVLFFYNETLFEGINGNETRINAGFAPSSFGSSGEPFMIPGVFIDNSTNLDLAGGNNTGVPGFYAFRVDRPVILQPGGMYTYLL